MPTLTFFCRVRIPPRAATTFNCSSTRWRSPRLRGRGGGGALEQGFPTLRDMETEGAGYGDVGIKQAIEGGYIPGPRLFVSTRAISTTGGYPPAGSSPELV